MKVCDCQNGSIVYAAWVPTYDLSKPVYEIKKYVVVLAEHNIVRFIHNDGKIDDNTRQIHDDVFECEADALMFVAYRMQDNLDKLKESFSEQIKSVLKKAVTKIEGAI